MNKELIIFTLNGCSFCNIIKKILCSKSIQFIECEINEYPDLWKQVVNQTDSDYLPTFFIREGNNMYGKVFCARRDFNDDENIIKILETHLN